MHTHFPCHHVPLCTALFAVSHGPTSHCGLSSRGVSGCCGLRCGALILQFTSSVWSFSSSRACMAHALLRCTLLTVLTPSVLCPLSLTFPGFLFLNLNGGGAGGEGRESGRERTWWNIPIAWEVFPSSTLPCPIPPPYLPTSEHTECGISGLHILSRLWVPLDLLGSDSGIYTSNIHILPSSRAGSTPLLLSEPPYVAQA